MPELHSEPHLTAFNPHIIPYQFKVLNLIRTFDYSQGNLEILLSGSVGSAKSLLIAHLVVTHCLVNPGSIAFIGRRSLPDLKKTIWQEVIDHIDVDLIEGKDYFVNKSALTIKFRNGSKILTGSWADGKYKKFRSLKLSFVAIEELTENDEDDRQAFIELKARLRRLTKIKENVMIAATNPDSPTHWAYKYFIEPTLLSDHLTKKVFYSNTTENPFLDPVYIRQLKQDYSPREARRYLGGEWIELYTDFIYHEYRTEEQYKRDLEYKPNPELPIHITFDFNIGHGKPMSSCLFQFDPKLKIFHFFAESIIEGARTADILEDYDARGLLIPEIEYEINGDASGKHRDTRSSRSDYDIIFKELTNRGIKYKYNVPMANPAIRLRHNKVNAYCRNELGQIRLFLYKGCVKCDEGLRLVQVKKGANYVEDDSKDYQHVTTAIGYGIIATLNSAVSKPQGMVQL